MIYLLLKVFDPSLVDTLFSSYAFSPLIPTAVCQGALMAFLSLSQPLRLPFFTTVVVEVKRSEMEKNNVFWSGLYKTSIGLFFPLIIIQIWCKILLMGSCLKAYLFVKSSVMFVICVLRHSVSKKTSTGLLNSFFSFCTSGPNLSNKHNIVWWFLINAFYFIFIFFWEHSV